MACGGGSAPTHPLNAHPRAAASSGWSLGGWRSQSRGPNALELRLVASGRPAPTVGRGSRWGPCSPHPSTTLPSQPPDTASLSAKWLPDGAALVLASERGHTGRGELVNAGHLRRPPQPAHHLEGQELLLLLGLGSSFGSRPSGISLAPTPPHPRLSPLPDPPSGPSPGSLGPGAPRQACAIPLPPGVLGWTRTPALPCGTRGPAPRSAPSQRT